MDRPTPTAAVRTRRIRERASEGGRGYREGTLPFPPLSQVPDSVSSLVTVNTQPICPLGGDEYPMIDLLGSPRPAQHFLTENQGLDAWNSSDTASPLFGLKLPDDLILFPFEGGSDERFLAAGRDPGFQPQAGRANGENPGVGDVAAACGTRALPDPMEENVEEREGMNCGASLTEARTADAIIALSRLNESITRHLSNLDLFQWQAPPMVGICAARINGTAGNPVAQVLQSTADFSAILKRLLSPAPVSPSPMVEVSALDSAFFSSAHTSHSESSSAISSLPPRPRNEAVGDSMPMQLGMPTLLLVLSNYLQLLRLYNNIFCYARRSLAEMTDETFASFEIQTRGISQQSPLRVGSLDVSQGQLYVKVLVQVMEHQLENVQRLMGLPPEYRLSQRVGRRTSGGIFSRVESSSCSDLLRAAMSSDTEPREDVGQALVSSLRENMEHVRRAVED